MPLPLSKSQIEKLGKRLISQAPPAQEDLDLLYEILSAYAEALDEAVTMVETGLGAEPTFRVKNTGTILEKLHRHGGSWLKSIQDLAGMRIVCDTGRDGQDRLVAGLVELFHNELHPPKIKDRRASPTQGYRAVHVIVYLEGVPIEIQVRTKWQHEWAELFEKLADLVGRGIRYGEAPQHWWEDIKDQLAIEGPEDLARFKRLYDEAYELRRLAVFAALMFAKLVATIESADPTVVKAELGPNPEAFIHECLSDLRSYLAELKSLGTLPS